MSKRVRSTPTPVQLDPPHLFLLLIRTWYVAVYSSLALSRTTAVVPIFSLVLTAHNTCTVPRTAVHRT